MRSDRDGGTRTAAAAGARAAAPARTILRHVLLAGLFADAAARPNWSWDVLPNYFHCANVSGEWSDEALRIIAQSRSWYRISLDAPLAALTVGLR